MRYALLATLLAASLFALPRVLDAQQIRSPIRFIDETQSLGVYAGFLATSPGTPAVGPQDTPIFGIRYNLRLTGPLSGEAAISFAPAERNIIADDTLAVGISPVATGDVAAMNIVIAEAGLRFHFTGPRTWRGLAPYVVGAGGVAADLNGRGELDEALPAPQQYRFGPSFAVSIGAGTDWFLSERLSLRLEARDHIFRLRVPAGLRGTAAAETQWTNNIGISLGTALHF